ncbi:hypothetical protein H632_c194p0 [Helicosporidium sp. ATCC 50920]|nr:hypothetical protein H632_c194p0 [Helicosporidium sp. ATCC 50920]|eukprot:KDD76526.1 hypothetical protein H632_c194p0 [Helicosporidium sp. ATCC 50920]
MGVVSLCVVFLALSSAVLSNATSPSPSPSPRSSSTIVDYDDLIETLTQNVLAAYQRGANSVSSAADTLEAQSRGLSEQMRAGFDTYQSRYCTPAEFEPSTLVPANFSGMALSVEFSTGNCTFNETRWIVDGVKELNCFEPSIVYEKIAPSFTSKHLSAATFKSKECAISKEFGTEEIKNLLTFDGHEKLDTQKLTEQISAELKALLSTLGVNGGPLTFPMDAFGLFTPSSS